VMRAAVYTRVSTEEQARGGVSLEVQEDRCIEVAEAAGATEVVVYRDEGYSARTLKRPSLARLRSEIASLDLVVVWKIDRLSRSTRDLLNLLAELAEAGVGVRSATEPFDLSSGMGRATVTVLGALAELTVDVVRENVRAALSYRAADGKPHGPAPFGYDWRRDAEGNSFGDRWEPVPEAAATVREIFRRYCAGESLMGLAIDLNRRAVPTATGDATWTHTGVRNILRNPAYIGLFRFGGEVHEGDHEALVDEATWRAAQRRLTRRAGTHPRSLDRSLSPIYRCGLCGGSMSRQKRDETHFSYACRQRREGIEHPSVYCSGNAADAVVWAWVRHLVDEDVIERAAELQAERARRQQAEEEKSTTAEQLCEVERRIEANLEAYHLGALPADMLRQQNEPLIADRERLRERLAAEAMQVSETDMRRLRETTREALDELIEGGDIDRQQELLSLLFERVEVLPGRRLVCHHRVGELPPKTLQLPSYFKQKRGRTDIDLQL